MNKDLRQKAVKIQGKSYVLVADRVVFFNEAYPNGAITTELISAPHDEEVVVRAIVTPDTDKPNRFFTGYSQAIKGQGYINKTSALENCETSAVGRALAMMGIGVIESIASVDEINKAKNTETYQKTYPVKNPTKTIGVQETLKRQIYDLCMESDVMFGKPEDYQKYVLDKTGMELKPVNFEAIRDTLKQQLGK